MILKAYEITKKKIDLEIKKTKSKGSGDVDSGGKNRKSKKSTKNTRKHRGIIQRGGKVGKLKKGYRYTRLKTKTGLPIIIKSKKNRL